MQQRVQKISIFAPIGVIISANYDTKIRGQKNAPKPTIT